VELRLALSTQDLPVAVSIYDVRGCLVRKMPAPRKPGKFTIEWDGLDAFGNKAASGAYFLSVASPGKVYSRKVILVR
jgi:flagellar hook assembly protein FlgD